MSLPPKTLPQGELALSTLLRGMEAVLDPALYVFVTLPAGTPLPEGLTPLMQFHESEGLTLITTQAQAQAANLPHAFPCRRITLNVHSALEAVGFIARIATELAAHNMGVNPVAGYFHDHLFIPDGREQDALQILGQIAAQPD